MKINSMKAYDTVRWDFLFFTLDILGFHTKMINWIKACVTTSKLCICLNGESVGFFNTSKGLRQNDLISPYFFVITIEVLSSLLEKMALRSRFNFYTECKKIDII